MTVSTLIKKLKKQKVILRGVDMPLVVLPLATWEEVEDQLAELASPKLLQSFARGRAAYRRGRTKSYTEVRKKLGL